MMLCTQTQSCLYAAMVILTMCLGLVAGLLLYAADIAMRMTQASNITAITAWRVIGKGSNRAIVFTLPVDKVPLLLHLPKGLN